MRAGKAFLPGFSKELRTYYLRRLFRLCIYKGKIGNIAQTLTKFSCFWVTGEV
jgi:hypothetical protein